MLCRSRTLARRVVSLAGRSKTVVDSERGCADLSRSVTAPVLVLCTARSVLRGRWWSSGWQSRPLRVRCSGIVAVTWIVQGSCSGAKVDGLRPARWYRSSGLPLSGMVDM